VDSAGQAAAHHLADSLLVALQHGASMDSLQRIYLDPVEERHVEGLRADSLPGAYAAVLAGLDSGKVTKVFELPSPAGPSHNKWAILQVSARTPAGVPSYDFMKELIRKRLADDLSRATYIKGLRAKSYVDIREP
jgi:hypothetical protein